MMSGENLTCKSVKMEPECAEGTDLQNTQKQLRTDKSSKHGKASVHNVYKMVLRGFWFGHFFHKVLIFCFVIPLSLCKPQISALEPGILLYLCVSSLHPECLVMANLK